MDVCINVKAETALILRLYAAIQQRQLEEIVATIVEQVVADDMKAHEE